MRLTLNRLLFFGLITFLGIGAIILHDDITSRMTILLMLALGISTLFWDQFFFFGQPKKKKEVSRPSIMNLFLWFSIIWYTQYYVRAGGLVILLENSESLRIKLSGGKGEFILLSSAILYVDIFYRKNAKYLEFLFFVFLYFVLITGVGWRSPGMYFLVWSFIVRTSRRGDEINIRLLHIVYMLSLLVFSSIVGLMRAGITIDKLGGILWNIRHLFTVNIINLKKVIDYTDQTYYRFGWTYLNDLSVAIPGSKASFTGVHMKNWTHTRFEGETMTITLPGELYLNFGYLGFISLVFLFPLIIRVVESYLLSSNRDSSIFLWSALSIFFVRISTGGVMPIFIFQLFPLIIIYFASRLRYG